jgi:hypothetical protein
MKSFADPAAILTASTHAPNDPVLRKLLDDRIHDWAATDLLGLTHLLIIEAGDSEQDIVDEVAFSPLVSSIEGIPYGCPRFEAPFDWMQAHPGWFELIQTFGDGFAFSVWVADDKGTDPRLLAMCREFATAEGVAA